MLVAYCFSTHQVCTVFFLIGCHHLISCDEFGGNALETCAIICTISPRHSHALAQVEVILRDNEKCVADIHRYSQSKTFTWNSLTCIKNNNTTLRRLTSNYNIVQEMDRCRCRYLQASCKNEWLRIPDSTRYTEGRWGLEQAWWSWAGVGSSTVVWLFRLAWHREKCGSGRENSDKERWQAVRSLKIILSGQRLSRSKDVVFFSPKAQVTYCTCRRGHAFWVPQELAFQQAAGPIIGRPLLGVTLWKYPPSTRAAQLTAMPWLVFLWPNSQWCAHLSFLCPFALKSST